MNPTAADVAAWMLTELESTTFLYQEVIVYQISAKFGSQFVYYNNNGNAAIDKGVLKEFRKLTGDKVVWERGERYWRKRADYDQPGRQQE
jgi:hypothetical protein